MMMNHVNVYVIDIIKLNTINVIDKSGCDFHNWYYMMIFFEFRVSTEDSFKSICLDTKCIMSLINRVFLQKHLSEIIVMKTASKITVHKIGSWTHECQKYVCLSIYLSNKLNEKAAVVHIVNNLQTNLLIDINIIKSEQISMNILSWKIIIEESHNMLVNLNIISQKEHIHHIIRSFSKIMISSWSVYQIRVKTDKSFFEDRDLVFYLIYSEIYNYIVDINMIFVHVQNNRSINMIISWHICLSNIAEYKEESCYAVSIKNIDFAVYKSSIKSVIKMFKICLFNEITIYSNKINKVAALTAVVKIYLDLWHDCDRIINISELNYLQISLKKNWMKKVTKLSK